MSFFHPGMRELQDRFEGRAVPDRLADNRMRTVFSGTDREFIETSSFFFLSTATPESVDCSFKGGDPGFVRVVGENVLEWPDYDGNRMYRSLGNIIRNPRVGLLFIRFDGTRFDGSARLRVNGTAELDESGAAREGLPGAKRIIRMTAEHIFTNCPRYIPTMASEEASVYTPRDGYTPPDPAWKSRDFVKDIFDKERG
ncbi:MAG: pyridoxamine 5'-phosphate oxidase family protein [Rhodospirillaceae bacterium]|nr:pyridoxamine 5'-phosphate oxidase family protein [Rhodospirillaceae bacterium]MDD9913456.1 pyridoxamine 5'-phosphate oxidase family protein [Rhodospirillaceae bacterium]